MLDFFKSWFDGFVGLFSGNSPILDLFTDSINFLFELFKFIPNVLLLIFYSLPNFARILYGVILGWLMIIILFKIAKFIFSLGG